MQEFGIWESESVPRPCVRQPDPKLLRLKWLQIFRLVAINHNRVLREAFCRVQLFAVCHGVQTSVRHLLPAGSRCIAMENCSTRIRRIVEQGEDVEMDDDGNTDVEREQRGGKNSENTASRKARGSARKKKKPPRNDVTIVSEFQWAPPAK